MYNDHTCIITIICVRCVGAEHLINKFKCNKKVNLKSLNFNERNIKNYISKCWISNRNVILCLWIRIVVFNVPYSLIYIYLLMFYVKFLFPAIQHNSKIIHFMYFILYPFTIQDNEWILSEHALSLSSCLLQNIFVQNL